MRASVISGCHDVASAIIWLWWQLQFFHTPSLSSLPQMAPRASAPITPPSNAAVAEGALKVLGFLKLLLWRFRHSVIVSLQVEPACFLLSTGCNMLPWPACLQAVFLLGNTIDQSCATCIHGLLNPKSGLRC